MSDPGAPRQLAHLFDSVRQSIVADGIVFALTGIDELNIVDIGDPGAPSLIGQYDGIRQINDLAAANNLLYLASDNGLYIVQIEIEPQE